MRLSQIARILAALAGLAAGSAAGAAPADEVVRLDVLPGWRTDHGTQMVGFRLTLAPGWKTYWRAPGDAGIPPEIDWTGSRNLSDARFHWPVPEVFDQSGMRSIGYSGQVVLPVELTLPEAGGPARMEGHLDIGVCEEVCVPVSLQFSADLPLDGRRDAVLAMALSDRPMTPGEAGAGRVACHVAPVGDGLALNATLTLPALGPDETVVIEPGDASIWAAPAKLTRNGDKLTAATRLEHVSGKAFALDRSAVTITVIGDGRSVEISGCPAG